MSWLLPLLLSSLHYKQDYIFLNWFIGLALCLIPITLCIAKTLSWPIALFFNYFTTYVVYQTLCSFNILSQLPLPNRIPLFLAAAVSYVCFVAICLGLMLLSDDFLKNLPKALPFYTLINSLYVIINWSMGSKFTNSMGFSGFLDYSGMNGVLIAITAMPSVVTLTKNHKDKLSWAVVLSSLGAIYLSRGSIPYGVLFCGGLGILLHKRVRVPWKLCSLILVPVAIAFLSEGKELFDSGQRFAAYKLFMTHWWQSGFIFTGFGPSSFQILSRGIQKGANFMVQGDQIWVWLWMHSDWLQTLFELGVIGLTLVIGIALQTFYKLFKSNDTTTFAIASALASSAIFDYPARLFPTAILIGWVVIYTARLGHEVKKFDK